MFQKVSVTTIGFLMIVNAFSALSLVIILGFIVSYITVVKILNFDPTLHSFSFFGTLIGLALANKYRLNGFGKKKAAKE